MEETLKMLSRIKQTADGKEFIEFLKTLSDTNYKTWKNTDSTLNDLMKGQAIAIDEMISLFTNCEQKLAEQNIKQEAQEWL
jgi:hemerythrin superfamily protein